MHNHGCILVRIRIYQYTNIYILYNVYVLKLLKIKQVKQTINNMAYKFEVEIDKNVVCVIYFDNFVELQNCFSILTLS